MVPKCRLIQWVYYSVNRGATLEQRHHNSKCKVDYRNRKPSRIRSIHPECRATTKSEEYLSLPDYSAARMRRAISCAQKKTASRSVESTFLHSSGGISAMRAPCRQTQKRPAPIFVGLSPELTRVFQPSSFDFAPPHVSNWEGYRCALV